MRSTQLKNQICPYLGQKSDPETAQAFPSTQNCCYHAKPANIVAIEHQQAYCLTGEHVNCEQIMCEPGKPLLASLRLQQQKYYGTKRKGSRRWIWLIVSLLLVSLGIIAYLMWTGKLTIASPGVMNQKATSTLLTSTDTQTSVSETLTATSTSIPTSEATTATKPDLSLEVPLGVNRQFLIHQIQEGESLDRIAADHGTTVEALVASNYRLPSPLFPGWAIVVPLNIVDVSTLPAFEIYSVKEETLPPELATRLSVDLDQFLFYNDIGAEQQLMSGDWLLVPRERVSIPTVTP